MVELRKVDIIVLVFAFFLFIISFLIIRSFIVPLIFTFLLVYILNPIYKKLIKVFKNHSITSLLIITVFLLLFISPIVYSVFVLAGNFSNIENQALTNNLNKLSTDINQKYHIPINLNAQFKTSLSKIGDFFSSMLLKIPNFIFNIFLIIFFYYYFSKNYNQEVKYFKNVFYGKKADYIKKKIEKLIEGLIYGQILVKLILTVIGIIGFLILGIQNAILWGTMMFFAAFLPVIGTGIIWGPVAILELLHGNLLVAIGVLIVGFIIGTVDNILLPYFISEKTNVGPILTLISIIGGIQFFGFYGILLGPFFLGLLLVVIDEILYEIRTNNPNYKKFIWTDKERREYRKLKTEESRRKFIDELNKRYQEKVEKVNNNVSEV